MTKTQRALRAYARRWVIAPSGWEYQVAPNPKYQGDPMAVHLQRTGTIMVTTHAPDSPWILPCDREFVAALWKAAGQ